MRSMVDTVNRSLAKVSAAFSWPPFSQVSRLRSNWVVRVCHSMALKARPEASCSCSRSATCGWWLYMTWNNGE
ncbi:hypothetical protein D3C80_1554070 [compost metagenome]